MSAQQSKILVFSEEERLMKQLLTKARQSHAGTVGLALIGDDIEQVEFGKWGADTVYRVHSPLLDSFNLETYTDALAGVIEKADPDLILVGGTKQGLELSARVAERLDIGLASWCVDFAIDNETQEVTAKCMIYSGIGQEKYRLNTQPAMATVDSDVFEQQFFPENQAERIAVEANIRDPRLKVLEEKGKMAAGERLVDAPVIIDVGQGFEEKEDLALAEELARLLDGQVACTRPIASERDWLPVWIGLSGAQLSPQLCFAIGVSGAIQHMIGIRDSDLIVAVNKDEHAGVHLQADYGVVADLYEFVPALIEVMKERSIKLAE